MPQLPFSPEKRIFHVHYTCKEGDTAQKGKAVFHFSQDVDSEKVQAIAEVILKSELEHHRINPRRALHKVEVSFWDDVDVQYNFDEVGHSVALSAATPEGSVLSLEVQVRAEYALKVGKGKTAPKFWQAPVQSVLGGLYQVLPFVNQACSELKEYTRFSNCYLPQDLFHVVDLMKKSLLNRGMDSTEEGKKLEKQLTNFENWLAKREKSRDIVSSAAKEIALAVVKDAPKIAAKYVLGAGVMTLAYAYNTIRWLRKKETEELAEEEEVVETEAVEQPEGADVPHSYNVHDFVKETLEKAKEGEAQSIDLGYWKDSKYQPLMAVLERREITAETVGEPSFYLTIYEADAFEESKKSDPFAKKDRSRKFIFSEERIYELLLQHTKNHHDASTAVQKAFKEKGLIGGVGYLIFKSKVDNAAFTNNRSTVMSLIEGKAQEELNKRTISIKESKKGMWDSLFVWIEASDLQESSAKELKASWEMAIFQNYKQHFIEIKDSLKAKEKEYHLTELYRMRAKIEKQYDKLFKQPGALKEVWGEECLELEALGKESYLGVYTTRKHLWKAELKFLKRSISENVSIEYQKRFFSEELTDDLSLLDRLTQSEVVDFRELKPVFDRVFQKIDEAYQNKKYDEIVPIATRALEFLPSILEWDRLSEVELNDWSFKITTLTHHLWESFLRGHQSRISENTAFALANSKGAIAALVIRQGRYAAERVQEQKKLILERADKINLAKQRKEEVDPSLLEEPIEISAFDKAYAAFYEEEESINLTKIPGLDSVFYLYEKHPFFRPGSDPTLSKRRERFYQDLLKLRNCKSVPFDLAYHENVSKEDLGDEDVETFAKIGSFLKRQASDPDLGERREFVDIHLPALLHDFREISVYNHTLLNPTLSLLPGGIIGTKGEQYSDKVKAALSGVSIQRAKAFFKTLGGKFVHLLGGKVSLKRRDATAQLISSIAELTRETIRSMPGPLRCGYQMRSYYVKTSKATEKEPNGSAILCPSLTITSDKGKKVQYCPNVHEVASLFNTSYAESFLDNSHRFAVKPDIDTPLDALEEEVFKDYDESEEERRIVSEIIRFGIGDDNIQFDRKKYSFYGSAKIADFGLLDYQDTVRKRFVRAYPYRMVSSDVNMMLTEKRKRVFSKFDSDLSLRLSSLFVYEYPNQVQVESTHRFLGKVSSVSLINAFELILNRPDALEDTVVQRCLDLILKDENLIEDLMQKDPQFFQRLKVRERLSAHIQEAIEKRRSKTVFFLLKIGEIVNSKIAEKLLDFDSSIPFEGHEDFKGKDLLVDAVISSHSSVEVQKQAASDLIYFYQKRDLASVTEKDWVVLLHAFSVLRYLHAHAANSFTIKQQLHWMEFEFLPQLKKRIKSSESKNNFLTHFWNFQMSRIAASPIRIEEWEEVEPDSDVYRVKDQPEGPCVDLQLGVSLGGGKELTWISSLPLDLVQSSLFKMAQKSLEIKELTGRISVTREGDMEWKINSAVDPVRIRWNRLEGAYDILRSIPDESTTGGKEKEYRFCQIKADSKSKMALLADHGIWINEQKPNEGLLIIPGMDPLLVSCIKVGSEVCVDTIKSKLGRYLLPETAFLKAALPCLPKDDKLYGFGSETGVASVEVVEVKGKGIPLHLEKRAGQWVTVSPYDGYVFKESCDEFERKFHPKWKKFGVALEKVIRSRDLKDPSSQEIIERRIILIPNDEDCLLKSNSDFDLLVPDAPLLSVSYITGNDPTFSHRGMKGSAASFFYLALMASKEKEYDKALYFLNLASSSNFEKNEFEVFQAMKESWLSTELNEKPNKFEVALRLKALIFCEKIERNYRKDALAVEQEMEMLAEMLSLQGTYNELFKKSQGLLDDRFRLSIEELEVLLRAKRLKFADILCQPSSSLGSKRNWGKKARKTVRTAADWLHWGSRIVPKALNPFKSDEVESGLSAIAAEAETAAEKLAEGAYKKVESAELAVKVGRAKVANLGHSVAALLWGGGRKKPAFMNAQLVDPTKNVPLDRAVENSVEYIQEGGVVSLAQRLETLLINWPKTISKIFADARLVDSPFSCLDVGELEANKFLMLAPSLLVQLLQKEATLQERKYLKDLKILMEDFEISELNDEESEKIELAKLMRALLVAIADKKIALEGKKNVKELLVAALKTTSKINAVRKNRYLRRVYSAIRFTLSTLSYVFSIDFLVRGTFRTAKTLLQTIRSSKSPLEDSKKKLLVPLIESVMQLFEAVYKVALSAFQMSCMALSFAYSKIHWMATHPKDTLVEVAYAIKNFVMALYNGLSRLAHFLLPLAISFIKYVESSLEDAVVALVKGIFNPFYFWKKVIGHVFSLNNLANTFGLNVPIGKIQSALKELFEDSTVIMEILAKEMLKSGSSNTLIDQSPYLSLDEKRAWKEKLGINLESATGIEVLSKLFLDQQTADLQQLRRKRDIAWQEQEKAITAAKANYNLALPHDYLSDFKEQADKLLSLFIHAEVDVSSSIESAKNLFSLSAAMEELESESVELHENLLRKQGLDVAAEKKRNRRYLPSEGKLMLSFMLEKSLSQIQNELAEDLKNLLRKIKEEHHASERLQKMLAEGYLHDDEEYLRLVLDEYQNGALKSEDLSYAVCKYLDTCNFLFALERAGQIAKQVVAEENEEISISLQQDLYAQVQLLGTIQRHVVDGSMKDPAFNRKVQVAEWNRKIYFRDEQLQIVKKMAENPKLLLLSPPGTGKSSVVFPLLLAILREKILQGEMDRLLVVLETEALVEIAEQNLDQVNKPIFGQDRLVFNFNGVKSFTSYELSQQYENLLHAKKLGHYVVTSIESLSSLRNTCVRKIKESAEALTYYQTLEKEVDLGRQSKEALKEASQNLYIVQEEVYWLKKLYHMLSSKGRFIADEVDDIFDIHHFVNEALGDESELNPTILNTTRYLFESILKLNEGKLDGVDLRKVAESLYNDESFFGFSNEWDEFKRGYSKDSILEFLLKKDAEPLRNTDGELFKWEKTKAPFLQTLASLRHLMSVTIPQVIADSVDIDYRLHADGYSVEPLKKADEQPNSRHSDEYEFITYHFACYAKKAPSHAFFEKQWKRIQYQILAQKAPLAWQEWLASLDLEGVDLDKRDQILYERLNSKEAWKVRLSLLADEGMAKDYIKIARQQIRCNVQDALCVPEAEIQGASGTINAYALPELFERDPSVDSKEGIGELDLALADMFESKMDEKVSKITDATLMRILADSNYHALINQGGILQGLSAKQVVEKLREMIVRYNHEQKQEGKPLIPMRQFFYRDDATKKLMMWNPDMTEPKPYDAQGVDLKNSFFSFRPSDTRGTDFKIPNGMAAFVCGKTQDEEQREQAFKRLRQFGKGQAIKIFTTDEVEAHYRAVLGIEEERSLTVSDVVAASKAIGLSRRVRGNIKSLYHNILAPRLAFVQKALFKPPIRPCPYQFSEVVSKELLEKAHIDAKLYDLFRDYFLVEKKVDFESEFLGVKKKDAIEEIKAKCQQELSKVKELKSAFRNAFLYDLLAIENGATSKINYTRIVSNEDSLSLIKNVFRRSGFNFDSVRKELHVEWLDEIQELWNGFEKIEESVESELLKITSFEKEQEHMRNLPRKLLDGSFSSNEDREKVQQQEKIQESQKEKQLQKEIERDLTEEEVVDKKNKGCLPFYRWYELLSSEHSAYDDTVFFVSEIFKASEKDPEIFSRPPFKRAIDEEIATRNKVIYWDGIDGFNSQIGRSGNMSNLEPLKGFNVVALDKLLIVKIKDREGVLRTKAIKITMSEYARYIRPHLEEVCRLIPDMSFAVYSLRNEYDDKKEKALDCIQRGGKMYPLDQGDMEIILWMKLRCQCEELEPHELECLKQKISGMNLDHRAAFYSRLLQITWKPNEEKKSEEKLKLYLEKLGVAHLFLEALQRVKK